MAFKSFIGRQVLSPGKLTRAPIVVFFAGWLVIILSSCDSGYPQPSFENVPAVMAQAPCITNVCIGTVGREDIFEELLQSELLLNIRSSASNVIAFGIKEGGTGDIIFKGDEVERIRLRVVGVPLSMVLDALGQPDELFLMFGCGRGSHVHGKLFYQDKGIEVQVQFPVDLDERAMGIALTDRSSMAWVWYFDPVKYDEWLLGIREDLGGGNGYFDLAPSVTAEMLAAAVQPWPGLNTPIQTLDLCPL